VSRRWRVVVVTTTAVFLAMLDVTVVNLAFAEIVAAFSPATPADGAWVISAYSLVLAALLVPAGRAADRFGRKRIWKLGMVVFIAASAACAAAPSLAALIAARVVQAIGVAVVLPASLALLLPEFPSHRRATAVAPVVGHRRRCRGARPGRWRRTRRCLRLAGDLCDQSPAGRAALWWGRELLRDSPDANPGPLPDPLSVGLIIVSVRESRSRSAADDDPVTPGRPGGLARPEAGD
jgi:Major Facilitator Superfamily